MIKRPGSLVVVLATLMALVSCASEPHQLAGYERTPTPNVADLSMPAVTSDGSEKQFSFVAEDDDLLLVYFGYTRCPDVCPTTLADVRQALRDIGGDADRVQLVMVTVEPHHDTPEILAGYIGSFVEGSTALRTLDEPLLRSVANGFGADYGTTGPENEVFHTASLYAIDASGDLILTWAFGTPADDIGADVKHLLSKEA